MKISKETVKNHISNICRKLNAENKVEILIAMGWVRAPTQQLGAREYAMSRGWSP